MKATPRAAMPCVDQLAPRARRPRRTPRCSSAFSVWSAAARRRAARRPHEPREDQLARRLGARERLGERQQLRRAPPSACGATRIERSGTAQRRGTRRATARAPPRAPPRPARRARCSGRAACSSGPAMNVVTSAISTSIANSAVGDHALLEREVEHDQLGQAARVHQRPDHRRRRASRSRSSRAAIAAPNELADDRDGDQQPASCSHSSGRSSRPTLVLQAGVGEEQRQQQRRRRSPRSGASRPRSARRGAA